MQGTGNYRSASGPSGEEVAVRRVFPVFVAKKDAEEVKKSVENLAVTRKMILSLSLSLSLSVTRVNIHKNA